MNVYRLYGVPPAVYEQLEVPKCYIHDPSGSAIFDTEPDCWATLLWCEYRMQQARQGTYWHGGCVARTVEQHAEEDS